MCLLGYVMALPVSEGPLPLVRRLRKGTSNSMILPGYQGLRLALAGCGALAVGGVLTSAGTAPASAARLAVAGSGRLAGYVQSPPDDPGLPADGVQRIHRPVRADLDRHRGLRPSATADPGGN